MKTLNSLSWAQPISTSILSPSYVNPATKGFEACGCKVKLTLSIKRSSDLMVFDRLLALRSSEEFDRSNKNKINDER
jgi:hypothetical protein